MSDPVAEALDLFRQKGHSEYGGEPVTQLEHGLQAAALAIRDGADDSLIAAALLHDVGHLLHDLPDDAPDHGVDDIHEQIGAEWLAARFTPEVAEPVRLHVPAKRYLCAVDSWYYSRLSESSKTSLALQGGPMTESEAQLFEHNPHYGAAVRLRRWDDEAKVPGAPTPTLDDLAHLMRGSLKHALLEKAGR